VLYKLASSLSGKAPQKLTECKAGDFCAALAQPPETGARKAKTSDNYGVFGLHLY
jgi:hypothetical protein